MQKTLIFILVLVTNFSIGQELSHHFLAHSGNVTDDGISIVTSVGHSFVGYVENDQRSVNLGFIQPSLAVSTSTYEVKSELNLKLFPNPVRDVAILEIVGTESFALRFEIYNLSGQRVEAGPLVTGSNELSLSHLPPGYYCAKIKQENIYAASLPLVKIH